MPAPWEPWLLLCAAGFQFLVGAWWWRGEHLPGTRGWVASLFLLNGAVTLFGGGLRLGAPGAFERTASFVDMWTAFFLLGLAVTAFELGHRSRWLADTALAVTGVLALATSLQVGRLGGLVSLPALPTDFPLAFAMVGTGVALVARSESWDTRRGRAWLLVLAAIGVRFTDIQMGWIAVLPADFGSADLPTVLQGAARTASMLALLAGALALVRARWRADGAETRNVLDVALGLLIGGYLLGLAKFTGPWAFDLNGYLLSLVIVRPFGFMAAQAHLVGASLWAQPRGRFLLAAWGIVGASLVALFVATEAWRMSTFQSLAVSTGVAVLGFSAFRGLWSFTPATRTVEPRPSETPPGVDGGAEARKDLVRALEARGLDPTTAVLPPDSMDRFEWGRRAYEALDPPDQANLALPDYKERVLIALAVAPQAKDGGYPFDRTSSGLFLTTHLKYRSVSGTVKAANEQAERIARALGVPTQAHQRPLALIRVTDGFAAYHRGATKVYALTPLGEAVANRLIERFGLGGIGRDRLALVLGRRFGDPVAKPVPDVA